jgi:hypothetical protein
MQSEPDNRMDDLLKTYAKKRRDQAGTPSPLHPATRRILQAEAAKLRPKGQDRKESWFSALFAFSPRYASAAAALALVGVGAWSFFHFGQPPKQMALADAEAERVALRPEPAAPVLASGEKKESGIHEFQEADGGRQELRLRLATTPAPAEPLPALREEAGDQLKAMADESTTKRVGVELAANEALRKNLTPGKPSSLSAPAVTPPSIAAPVTPLDPSASRQLAGADAKDQVALKGARALNDSYAKLPQQSGAAGANAQNVELYSATAGNALARQNAIAPLPQPVPPATTPQGPVAGFSSLTSQQAPTATGLNRFYSQEGAVAQANQNTVSSRNRFSQTPPASRTVSVQPAGRPAASVLAEFEFEQAGNRVRVVDADGSVYDGLIEDAARTDLNNKSKAVARRDSLLNVPRSKPGDRPATLADNAGADAPVLNFRASGTNRTLRQQVTINGVLYGPSTNFGGQSVQAALGAVQQTTQQIGNANLSPVQRIQGRVQVGTGAETRLDAVRR